MTQQPATDLGTTGPMRAARARCSHRSAPIPSEPPARFPGSGTAAEIRQRRPMWAADALQGARESSGGAVSLNMERTRCVPDKIVWADHVSAATYSDSFGEAAIISELWLVLNIR